MKGDGEVALDERLLCVEDAIDAALYHIKLFNEQHPTREGSLANTKLQEAMFWASNIVIKEK